MKLKPVSRDLCDTGAVLYQLSYDTISSGLNLFQALMSQLLKVVCITVMTNHVSIYFSAVQIHDLSYIHLHYSPSTGILKTHKCDHLPDGLIAQLVEHCTSIAEVMDSNPIQA